MKTFIRVFRFVKPYRLLFAVLVLSNIVLGMFGALTMAIIKPVMSVLFDETPLTQLPLQDVTGLGALKDSFFGWINSLIISDSQNTTLLRLSVFIVSVFLIKNVTKYLSGINFVRLTESIIRDMRSEVFTKLMKHSMSYFNQNKTGELMALVTNEIGAMHGSIVPFFMQVFRNPVEIILLLTLLLSLSIKLTLIAMSTSVITLILIRSTRSYLRRYATRMADSTAGYIGTLQEAVSSIRVVKAFNAEKKISKNFYQHTSAYARSAVKLARINEAIPSINEVFAIVALSVVLFVGGHEVFNSSMRGSDLMTFLFALFAIMSPTISLVSVPGQIQRGIVAAERVFALIDLQPTLIDGTRDRVAFTNELKFESVRFSYNEHVEVLKDVSLRIPRGKKIAFVGSSGSGKSTLIDLLVRFYDPQGGRITLDGVDIREFAIPSYRATFGIVSQDAVLFNNTIASNIAFGTESLTIDDCRKAAVIAHADEFIRALPQGYDTLVGDRGVLLSGGQRQRIAIARAIAMNPDILVFDEATSALDSESEKTVQMAINEVLKDRTAVIIAHRLSTIINCDNIVVFDQGRIVEQGTHLELIDIDGAYKRLYDIQFAQHNGEQNEGR